MRDRIEVLQIKIANVTCVQHDFNAYAYKKIVSLSKIKVREFSSNES